MNAAEYEKSVLREKIIEHLFLGELLRKLWIKGIYDVEVLHAECDAFGYDLVFVRQEIIRHIQLKANRSKRLQISRSLAAKAGACVVLVEVNSANFEMGPYLWFGNGPHEAFPSIAEFPPSKRTTPNSNREKPERKNHVDVPRGRFKKLATLDELIVELFGELN